MHLENSILDTIKIAMIHLRHRVLALPIVVLAMPL